MSPPLLATRLLDQVRERIRYAHYSLSTERAYVYWIRWFCASITCNTRGRWVQARSRPFLCWLANGRQASASTHKQDLAALLFLYKQVLGVKLPWLEEIGRPRTPQRIP